MTGRLVAVAVLASIGGMACFLVPNPRCASACDNIYGADGCAIAVAGFSDAAGRSELIRLCTDDCASAMGSTGEVGDFDPFERHTSGETITLSGRAFNTNAVANFLENLDRVQEFQEPVLQDTSQVGQTYSFVIRFSFTQLPVAEGHDGTPAAG